MTLRDYLTRDHERLDALLAAALDDEEAYREFRAGLLRHIGIGETVLFPELRKRHGQTALERQLHKDHAALAVLLVPPPTVAEIDQIRAILETHNPLEEDPGGLYELLDDPALFDRARAYPPVKLVPNTDSEFVRSAIEQLLRDRL